MSVIELLKEYLEREKHNVFCYSATYTMDTPKRGYEREFREANEKVDLLTDMIAEEEYRQKMCCAVRQLVDKALSRNEICPCVQHAVVRGKEVCICRK